MLQNNSKLIKICLVKSVMNEYAGAIYDEIHTLNLQWATACHDLREITVMNYLISNLVKIPPTVRHLMIQSPIGLENVVWISHEMKQIRVS